MNNLNFSVKPKHIISWNSDSWVEIIEIKWCLTLLNQIKIWVDKWHNYYVKQVEFIALT